MTTETTTAHYKGDPLAGAKLAHTFTHCGIVHEVYRTATHVRVVLGQPGGDEAREWALDAEVDAAGYLRVCRWNGDTPLDRNMVLGLVGRVQGELYDGVSGAVYTVSGPQG